MHTKLHNAFEVMNPLFPDKVYQKCFRREKITSINWKVQIQI